MEGIFRMKKKFSDLLEERSRLVHSMREITENPKADNGDLTKDQSEQFERMKTDLDAMEKRIERQQHVDEAERRMQGQQITGNNDQHFDEAAREFSIRKAIASMVPDLAQNIDFGREREISQEIARRSGQTFQGIAVPMQAFEKRTITTAAPVGGPGSNIISTDHMGSQYIDRLRANLVINKLGARVLNGLVGNIDIPKLTSSTTAGWFAEDSAISTSDAEVSKVSMTPKHVGARTEFSRNMLLQSSPDIENLLRDDFAKILAEAVDSAAIQGGGTNEPSGILDNGSLDTTTSLATPTWAGVLSLIELIQTANSEGTAFLTNPSVVKTLRSTAKVTSTDSAMIMESPNSLAGYNCAVSNLVPSDLGAGSDSALIFGKWSDLLVGYWSAFDLLVNPYETTAYSKGNVQVRGIVTMDVVPRHIESFAAAIDL